MHRVAEPEEMVGMVLFLCSKAASYVTGQVFVVGGGQMIRGLVPVETTLPPTHGLYASGSVAAKA
jgi:enoyl-[acyl-carrier-protein] reductase (NADH)